MRVLNQRWTLWGLGATSMQKAELQRVLTCTRNPKERGRGSQRLKWDVSGSLTDAQGL